MTGMQCDAIGSSKQVLAWALCPAAAAVHAGKLAESQLVWEEAAELLHFLPFVLFRFPHHRGGGLLAIIVASFTNPGPKAPTPTDSLRVPTNDNSFPPATSTAATTPTTSATSKNLTVKNRFARSFSQLVASQLVPGDLITMAKSQGILTNMGVDYVVVFRFATTGKTIGLFGASLLY